MAINSSDLNINAVLKNSTEASKRKNSEINKKKLEAIGQQQAKEIKEEDNKIETIQNKESDIKLISSAEEKEKENSKKGKQETHKKTILKEDNKGIFLNLKE